MDRGQQSHLESPLNQPRPPTPTSQKPQASSIPKALILCHLCLRPCWSQEMLGHPPTRGRHTF